ncbi:MAG: 50S ribosome-binding GTPase, partial [Oligoflexia bacterium]|nr:50S ribosome-binding GTPase [Oligoflexia bacterium]
MINNKNIRPHIGIFGRTNTGKSSIINALSGEDVSIVSDEPGTTTDPVKKYIEIPGIGPVVFIDTAGLDDTGKTGEKRKQKTVGVFAQADLAILVTTNNTWDVFEDGVIESLSDYKIPVLIVHNKSDLEPLDGGTGKTIFEKTGINPVETSVSDRDSINALIERLKAAIPASAYIFNTIIGDLVKYGDVVLLVTPIDMEAPEGRLILPQIQTIRDVLDNDCVCIVVKERELDIVIRKMKIRP